MQRTRAYRITMVLLGGLGCHSPSVAPPSPPPIVAPPGAPAEFQPLVDAELRLLVTPSPEGHQPFTGAIDEAKASVDMAMFHLTNPQVESALLRAAARGVQVRVILDGESIKTTHKYKKVLEHLREGGVDARASSSQFSITHEKAMVVDRALAFITAINLTRDFETTRDLGVVTRDKGVVDEFERVFAADWQNAANDGHETPELREPSLVWSPTNSRVKLIALIASAQHELKVTVENIGDPEIEGALIAAAKRGVAVELIVPLCDKNPNPLYNLRASRKLAAAAIAVRVMPPPETVDTPYMHSKMILVDGAITYVGSINFSVNSTTKARELGIIFANPTAAAKIHDLFETDWQHAVAIPSGSPDTCPQSP